MTFPRIRPTKMVSALFAPMLAAAMLLAAPTAQADDAPLSSARKAEIKKLIENYIVNHPDVILRAVQNYQEEQQALEEHLAKARLAEMSEQLERSKESPVGGNPKGDVTVVEFFDYRCGYCKRVYPVIRQAIESDGNVRLVFKEFPILGPESVFASRAALAVFYTTPAKYEAYHRALMDSKGALSDARVLQIAKETGLDPDAVKKAMDDPRVEREIRHNMALAQALNIRGTPAFVIGKELVPGAIDLDTLKKLVKAARAG